MHTDHENDDESVEKIVFDDTYLQCSCLHHRMIGSVIQIQLSTV